MFKKCIFWVFVVFSILGAHSLMAEQNIFIFLGAPGAGKGTLSSKLSEKAHLPHISTGDLLRAQTKKEGDLSVRLNEYLSKGELVPDEIILETLMNRVKDDDCKNGFILDGFPRTLTQAKKLDEHFPHKDHIIVVNVLLSPKVILERLKGRRICQNCSKGYHVAFNPPSVKNKCDDCGSKLISRTDDTIETIQKRLEIYKAQYTPIKRFYKEQYQWIDVRNDSLETCFTNMLEKIQAVDPEFVDMS